MSSGLQVQRLVFDWPPLNNRDGLRIHSVESLPGNVRHDMVVDSSMMGRIIGPKGMHHRELTAKTDCNVIIMDKEPPPGHAPDQRLVVLIGTTSQVTNAFIESDAIVQGAPGRVGGGRPPAAADDDEPTVELPTSAADAAAV